MEVNEKLINAEAAARIVALIKKNTKSRGTISVGISSWWSGGQRWARNKPTVTSDKKDVWVEIERNNGAFCRVVTNQIDEESIISACKYAEYYTQLWSPKEIYIDSIIGRPEYASKGYPVWSKATFNREQRENGELVHLVARDSQQHGLLSAGYIESGAGVSFKYSRDVWGRETNDSAKVSQAHCSITVRDPKGNGSGWAGGASYDLARLNPELIAKSALEKCKLSLNPVRIEPGRYQTILEPQASMVFFNALVNSLDRNTPEVTGRGEVFLEVDRGISRNRSKLGLKIVDDRITIHHNPIDSLMGTHVEPGVESVTLIETGILKNLWTPYSRALNDLVQSEIVVPRRSFKVGGTETPVEEMIGSMKRGLMVTRLSDPAGVGQLMTGTTRDGLWLIENGKVTKAVRNFRWTESPWFVLNNVEQIGMSIPTFTPVDIRRSLNGPYAQYASAVSTMIVPWIKINDFSFTSTVDAI